MSDYSDLAGCSALVTGGASGLGKATAEALGAAGAKVVVADLDEDAGREVASSVGGEFIRTDVSDLDQNLAAVALAESSFGGLDLAFLNAGVSTGCGLGEDFDIERYRRAMGANLDGVIFGVHACLPAMKAGGGGAIVATSSLAGLTAVPLDPIYAANKHGVVGLVRSLGPGLVDDGIRINAVCPGFADTKIIADFKPMLEDQGMPIIPAETVADVVMGMFSGEMFGECWWVQPGRPSEPFGFRNLPGPRQL